LKVHRSGTVCIIVRIFQDGINFLVVKYVSDLQIFIVFLVANPTQYTDGTLLESI